MSIRTTALEGQTRQRRPREKSSPPSYLLSAIADVKRDDIELAGRPKTAKKTSKNIVSNFSYAEHHSMVTMR
jgi:hypothetical protein